MIAGSDRLPNKSQDLNLWVCWFNERPLVPGGKYAVKHTSNEVKAVIKEVIFKMDINSLEPHPDDKTINMNDIGQIRIKTSKPLFFDSYTKNRITGSLIIIDEATNETMAAGMII